MADIMNRFIKILLFCLMFTQIVAEVNIYSKEENEYFSHGFGIQESAYDNENNNSGEVLIRKKREEDACSSVTCQNGGKCIKLKVGGFICACKSGYRGEYCDHSAKDCAFAPCRDLLSCSKLGESKGYVCICHAREFTFCTLHFQLIERSKDKTCTKLTCGGNGMCSKLSTQGAVCVCPPGQNDLMCSSALISLRESPKADCMETDYGHVCICPKGSGVPIVCARQTIISKEDDPCQPNPCKNKGICRVNTHSYKIEYHCACPLGFTGKTCQERMGNCTLMGCRKIQDCVSSPAGDICNCMGDVSGRLCKLGPNKVSSWDKVKTVVGKEHLLTAKTVLGIIVATIALLFIFLTVHCKRVNRRRSELRQEYMGLLKEGLIPGSLPPDWMTISSHLLKQTLCCAKSKLNTDFTPKKSSSRQSQQSRNDQERKEEALIALLSSRTDVQRSNSGHMSKLQEISLSQESEEEDAVVENFQLHPHEEPHLRYHSSQNLSRNAHIGIGTKTNIDPHTVYDYLKSKRPGVKQAGDSAMWKTNSDKWLKMSTAQGPINVMKKAGKHINSSIRRAKPYRKQFVNVRRKYSSDFSSVSESDEEESLISRRYPSYNNSALNRNVNTNYGSSDEEELGCNYNYPKADEYLCKHFPSPDAKYNVCRNNINSEYTKSNMRQASRLIYTEASPPSTAIVREIQTESYNQRTNRAIPHNMSEKAHEYIKYLSYNPADDCGSNRKSDLQNDPYDTMESDKYEDFEVLKASVYVLRNGIENSYASFNNREVNQVSNTTRAKEESQMCSYYSNTTGANGKSQMSSHRSNTTGAKGMSQSSSHCSNTTEAKGMSQSSSHCSNTTGAKEMSQSSSHCSNTTGAKGMSQSSSHCSNTTGAKGMSHMSSHYSNTTRAKGASQMSSNYSNKTRNHGYSDNPVEEYGIWSMTVTIPANEFENNADESWKTYDDVIEKLEMKAEVNYDQDDLLSKDKNDRKKGFSNTSSNNNRDNPHDFHKQTIREEHKKKTNNTPIVTAGDCTSDAGSDDFKHVKSFKEGGRKLYYISNSRREIHSSRSTADDSVEWKYDEDDYSAVAGNTEDTSEYEQSSDSVSTSQNESLSSERFSEKTSCTESITSSSFSTGSSFSTSSSAITSDSSSTEMDKPSSVNQNEVSVSTERNGLYVPADVCNSESINSDGSPLPYLSKTHTQSMEESEDSKNVDDLTTSLRESYSYESDDVGNISSSLRMPSSHQSHRQSVKDEEAVGSPNLRQTSPYQNDKETHIGEDEVGLNQGLNQTSFNDKQKEDDVNVPVAETVSSRCKHTYTPYTHLEQMLITDAKDYTFNCSNNMELSPSEDRGQYVETDISRTKPSPDHKGECGDIDKTDICSSPEERRQLENTETSCTNVSTSLTRSFMSESDSSQTLVASDQSFSSLWSLTDVTLVPAEDDSGSDSEEIWM